MPPAWGAASQHSGRRAQRARVAGPVRLRHAAAGRPVVPARGPARGPLRPEPPGCYACRPARASESRREPQNKRVELVNPLSVQTQSCQAAPPYVHHTYVLGHCVCVSVEKREWWGHGGVRCTYLVTGTVTSMLLLYRSAFPSGLLNPRLESDQASSAARPLIAYRVRDTLAFRERNNEPSRTSGGGRERGSGEEATFLSLNLKLRRVRFAVRRRGFSNPTHKVRLLILFAV